MPRGSSLRSRRRADGMGTVERIAATANATAPATAQDRGSCTTRSSVFTRTRPSGPGRITPRASSNAVPNCSNARRARSRSISTPFTSTLPHYSTRGLAERMKPVSHLVHPARRLCRSCERRDDPWTLQLRFPPILRVALQNPPHFRTQPPIRCYRHQGRGLRVQQTTHHLERTCGDHDGVGLTVPVRLTQRAAEGVAEGRRASY